MYGHYIVSLHHTYTLLLSHDKLQMLHHYRLLLTYSRLHYHASPRYSGSESKQSGVVKQSI